jgi:HD-GYP domain-containing protein (c-di-GMP phosphodiesterase class II)
MRLRPRRRVLLCGLATTLVIAILWLYRPVFLANFEYGAYDTLLRAARTRPPSGQIVIVDVDERSLAAIGQWPWRRDRIGTLIARMRELGASTIALDIILSEADRYDGTGVPPDEGLADTLRAGGVVLGYALTFDRRSGPSTPCVQHPLPLAVIQSEADQMDDPFFQATGAICSLPVLTEAADASGFLNAAPDPDGLLRRVPLLAALDGRVHPGLALAAVVKATSTHDVGLRVINVNAASLLLDRRTVPLDGKSNLLLRYRGGKRTFPYVSAADVLTGQTPAGTFKDKIVFVGTTALGTREVVATPIDTLFAGVEVQATVADNLLQQDFIQRPEYGAMAETQTVLGLGIVAALLVGRLGLAWGGLGVAVCLAAAWGGAVGLMSAGTFLSPIFPTLGLISALATMAVAQFTLERRRADQAGQDRVTSQRLMVQTLLSLTEVRDPETGRHSRRTQEYTRALARQLATHAEFRSYLTPERIELLASLAPLHDIGKVGVPDRLLNKPGALTAEEVVEMRKHPAHGRDVIVHAEQAVGTSDNAILGMAKDIVYTHHEKWDGTGYPEGLRGVDIPIVGRLIALVDVYDALTSRRVYREAMSHDDAVEFIVARRGTHFDPSVVDAFLEISRVVRRLRETAGDVNHHQAGIAIE